jgi:hypothetical protein
MIYRVKPESEPGLKYYWVARGLEFFTPTVLFVVAAAVTYFIFWPVAAGVGILYLLLLRYWYGLADDNEPITKRWQSSLEGRAASGELWQMYAEITGQLRKARWIECGDTPVEEEGQETDNAVALYKHPLINLLRAPRFILRLFRFEEYYQHLQGGPTIVALQYPDLHFSGSRAAWLKVRRGLTAAKSIDAEARSANDDYMSNFLRRLELLNEQMQDPTNATLSRRLETVCANEDAANRRLREAHHKRWLLDDLSWVEE